MSARWIAAGAALVLALALARGGEGGQSAPPASRPPQAANDLAPATEGQAPETDRRAQGAGAQDAGRSATPSAPPGDAAPPPASYVIPLDLGWDGAAAGEVILSQVRFRPYKPSNRGERFHVRVVSAEGGRLSYDLPVRGLLPRELARGQDRLVRHDEVMLARAPVLLRLPPLELPLRVDLLRPDGSRAATLDVRREAGGLKASVRGARGRRGS